MNLQQLRLSFHYKPLQIKKNYLFDHHYFMETQLTVNTLKLQCTATKILQTPFRYFGKVVHNVARVDMTF